MTGTPPGAVTARPAAAPARPILEIRSLNLGYRVRGDVRPVLYDFSLTIGRGEAVGIVGESGCGKSTAALAAISYLPTNARILSGEVLVDGQNLARLGKTELRQLRARTIAMVYQDPGKALNPTLRIGRQVAEVYEVAGEGPEQARARSREILGKVRIADPASVMDKYPHQLSGGMQQRVCIAMALAANPALLILDEPTTGLDATVEADVLDLIEDLQAEFGTSLMFISHNLGVVARMCSRVHVLYAGQTVEEGEAHSVFHHPRHPYTRALLRCLPRFGQSKNTSRLETIPGFLPDPGHQIVGCRYAGRCLVGDDHCLRVPPPVVQAGGSRTRCHYSERVDDPDVAPAAAEPPARTATATPLLQVDQLRKSFPVGGRMLTVLNGLTFQLQPGETLGLVGESGSGKTTLARILLGMMPADAGTQIQLQGVPLAGTVAGRSGAQVKAVQMVFQNPDSALNRAHPVRRILGRAIRVLGGLSGAEMRQRLEQLMDQVRLPLRYLDMRPRQLSGGLKQRVAIARALAGDPALVICDEPTSALDVSVQAAILNLLADLQAAQNIGYVFISHDLAVVRFLSDRIAVLYLGRLMEVGPAEAVFSGPHHPYTEALLSAVPRVEGAETKRIRLVGEVPSALNPPPGCPFQTRCPRKMGAICEQEEPPLTEREPGHAIRCHLPTADLGRVGGDPPPQRHPAHAA